MNQLVIALFIAVLNVASPSQSTMSPADTSGIVVKSIRWYKFMPGWDRPNVGAQREPYRDASGNVHNPPIVLDASPPPQVGYKYRAKVLNTGNKTIELLDWEYRFIVRTGEQVHRHQFRSRVKIGVGKSKELEGFSSDPPSRTIDIASLAKKRRYPFEEQVLINRVQYSDGSVWQRP